MEAGSSCCGTEVKSLRERQGADRRRLRGRRRRARSGCATPTSRPTRRPRDQNHDPERPRKLLLHRHEIERLIGKTPQRKGLTLVPTRIYFKGPRAKVELALARGKEQRDRRREIRDRDIRREVEREHRQRLR